MESMKGNKIKVEDVNKNEKAKQIALYLNEIINCPMDKQAYEIAKEHLGSSFCIPRSNGYKTWTTKE